LSWKERKQIPWVELGERWTNRSHGLNRRQFQSVLSELDAEYWGHLVSYRSPMAESWDSAETFCNFEAREVGG